ncbi:MAG: PKD domain-containing protein [Candidatus Thermoplasmatota archaeon]
MKTEILLPIAFFFTFLALIFCLSAHGKEWSQELAYDFIGSEDNPAIISGVSVEDSDVRLLSNSYSITDTDFTLGAYENLEVKNKEAKLDKNYTFYDNFTGKIINTQKWVEIDTYGLISQDEKIIVNLGGWNWGNIALVSSGLYYRGEGITIQSEFTPVACNWYGPMWGFKDTSNSYSYTNFRYAIYIVGYSIRAIYESGSAVYYPGIQLTTGKEYLFRIVLKYPSGATYYYSSDSGLNWMLIYDSNSNSDTQLRFGFTNFYNSFTIDNFYLFNMSNLYLPYGKYISKPYETGYSFDRTISFVTNEPKDTKISIYTRTGNTSIPDDTWSSWSSEYNSTPSKITSPKGKYIQYMAELSTTNLSKTPILKEVKIEYKKYIEYGYLTSVVHDTYVDDTTLLRINWTSVEQPNTYIIMKIRSSENFNMTPSSNWENCTKEQKMFSTPKNRYFQYEALFVAIDTSTTPILRKITIEYNSIPILSNGIVDENSGNISTIFEYQVEYFDKNNELPTSIKVFIDGVGKNMEKRIKGDVDCTDGILYIYRTKLSLGNHTYHFEAGDGLSKIRYPDIDEITGPYVGIPPLLLSGRVTPFIGNLSTEFFYETIYLQIENKRPVYLNVIIDGKKKNMSKADMNDDVYSDGCLYVFTTSLPLGMHTYYFETYDGYLFVRTEEIKEPIVENKPPKIIIDEPKADAIFYVGEQIKFDASKTYDPEGDILFFSWLSDIDGELSKAPMFKKELSRGKHKLTISVTDINGEVSSETRSITVLLQSQIILSSLTLLPSNPLANEETKITLELMNSGDVPGENINLVLYINDEKIDNKTLASIGAGEEREVTFIHLFTSGIFNITVKFEELERTTTIVVNAIPIAVIKVKKNAKVNEEISFDGLSSYDTDGKIIGYTWSFGDGEVTTGPIVSHKYKSDGRYNVRLTVEDDSRSTNSTFSEIDISPLPLPYGTTSKLGLADLHLYLLLLLLICIAFCIGVYLAKRAGVGKGVKNENEQYLLALGRITSTQDEIVALKNKNVDTSGLEAKLSETFKHLTTSNYELAKNLAVSISEEAKTLKPTAVPIEKVKPRIGVPVEEEKYKKLELLIEEKRRMINNIKMKGIDVRRAEETLEAAVRALKEGNVSEMEKYLGKAVTLAKSIEEREIERMKYKEEMMYEIRAPPAIQLMPEEMFEKKERIELSVVEIAGKETINCPSCGSIIEKGWRLCPYCEAVVGIEKEKIYELPKEEIRPRVEERYAPPSKEEIRPRVEERYVPPKEEIRPRVEERYAPPKEEIKPRVEERYVPPKEEIRPRVEERYVPPKEEIRPRVEERYVPPKEEIRPRVEERYAPPPKEEIKPGVEEKKEISIDEADKIVKFVEITRQKVKEMERKLDSYLPEAEKYLRTAENALRAMNYAKAKDCAERALLSLKEYEKS